MKKNSKNFKEQVIKLLEEANNKGKNGNKSIDTFLDTTWEDRVSNFVNSFPVIISNTSINIDSIVWK